MSSVIGVAITLVMVFGGYAMAGGKLEIILHALPHEMIVIGGAGVGSFVVANDFTTIKRTFSDIMQVLKGPKWKRADYQDVLILMFELLRLARESAVKVEAHIEAPSDSAIFARYPKIAADHECVEIICDTIRSILMNFTNPHQVEELFDKQLEDLEHESQLGAHALQKLADGLPALGIVAAVLGVIKTMASIDKPPEVLGQMIGGALVGTFLGVFLAYGLVGPLADKIAHIRARDQRFYSLIRETIVANLQMHELQICIEVARRNAPRHNRPDFAEVEESIKAIKKEAA